MSTPNSRKVFIVHGHDNEAKEGTARFWNGLVLSQSFCMSKQIQGVQSLKSLRIYSGDIAFAVVLLTPEDVGCPNNGPNEPKPRARQNVILELGYFMGRLAAIAYAHSTEGASSYPQIIKGVIYVELDTGVHGEQSWPKSSCKPKLPIDLTGLLSG